MSTITKLELTQINARLAAENAALRAELSSLRVLTKAHAPSQRLTRVHAYADRATAIDACKRCVASESNKVWTFKVVDNTVVAAARQW